MMQSDMVKYDMMRILMVNSYYYPNSNGGAEVVCRTLSEELAKKGHQVDVLTLDNHFHIDEHNGIRVIHLDTFIGKHRGEKDNIIIILLVKLTRMLDIASYFRYKKILKEEYDIINTHAIEDITPVIWLAAQRKRIPIVHTMHDKYLLCPRLFMLKGNSTECFSQRIPCRIRTFLYRKFACSIKAFISPSKALADSMPVKSVVIHNGVDIQQVQDERDYPAKRPFRYIYVGSLEVHKGIKVLFDAFGMMTGNIELHVVGDGPQYEIVKQKANEDKRIKCYGRVDHKQVKKIMKTCDCLILPSICKENCPLVILEAYSSGIPVIGSDTGGIPELIDDGETGFLFSTGNAEDLMTKMEAIREVSVWGSIVEIINQQKPDYGIDRQTEKTEKVLFSVLDK